MSNPGSKNIVIHYYRGRYVTAKDIPVLVYHEMNNDCLPSAVLCKGNDPESVSTLQFKTEMTYLYESGYHTVTMQQYVDWLWNARTLLPVKPILIIADNGIFGFLNGAQEIMASYGFTGVAAIVTGFADGASGTCAPKTDGINVQPGCPETDEYWHATWAQLRGFDPHVWSYILEAGASGHYVQGYNPKCKVFDTCLLPGETVAQWQARIRTELVGGEARLRAELGTRADPEAWVVPYSDLGYPRCTAADCTPQPATIPKNALVSLAARWFAAVFVEDANRNGVDNEHFRFDVNGQDTLEYFGESIHQFTAAGDFTTER